MSKTLLPPPLNLGPKSLLLGRRPMEPRTPDITVTSYKDDWENQDGQSRSEGESILLQHNVRQWESSSSAHSYGRSTSRKINSEEGQLRRQRNLFALISILLSIAVITLHRDVVLSRLPAIPGTGDRMWNDEFDLTHYFEVGREAAEMLPQREKRWSDEELALRQVRWEKHEADQSLKDVIATLDEHENRTRQWLWESRNISGRGVGVGLGRTEPPEPLFTWTKTSFDRPPSRDGEGPGLFERGSFEKYSDLLREWQTGKEVSACRSTTWQQNYTLMHYRMLRREEPLRLFTYHCPSSTTGVTCGGLADRFLGMCGTFLYALLTRRAFAVNWDTRPFDLLFDSAGYIDWSIPFTPAKPEPDPVYNDPVLVDERLTIGTHNQPPNVEDDFYQTAVRIWKENGPRWIRSDRPNRGVVLRSFNYTTDVLPALQDLELTPASAYACIFDYLFRLKPHTLNFVSQYTALFSLPTVFSIGIQVRMGDSAMRNNPKFHTASAHSAFFNCAAGVARAYALPSQRIVYYLVSDSEYLKEDAVRKFPGRVIVSGIPPKHTELKGTNTKDVVHVIEGLQGAVAEMMTLRSTDFQILTRGSGFGKIPVWARGRPGSTIQLPRGRQASKVNCGADTALKSFTDMATWWSLG
ncbi:hypothetical protein T439DRAFT_382226 [Meredithblackwellia eburnea MCA 4105]